MKNRGDRLLKKARINQDLVDAAIRNYNRNQSGLREGGTYIPRIHDRADLPKRGYYRIGRILRGEGREHARVYKCGESECEWCVENLIYKNNRLIEAAYADESAWAAGEHNATTMDVLWEDEKRRRIVFAEVLTLLSGLSQVVE